MAEESGEPIESLNSLVDKLAEAQEVRPDKWLIAPKGWLYKPSFTRPAQEIVVDGTPSKKPSMSNVFSDFKNMMKGSVGSTYKRRWFVLDTEKRCLIYYKDDTAGINESGYIDISLIIDVQRSKMPDAPPFAIDLASKDKYYTIAAENETQMVLWAYAINACRPQKIEGFMSPLRPQLESDAATRAAKWSRYECVFAEPGPLMMNVMGTTNKDKKSGRVLNNWIIVTSFESTNDGKPGRSELSGKISVKDYLVAVNGQDLMKFTFNESMKIIGNAPFPKTITFLKDNAGDRTLSRAEGWAVVYYPALNRKRRRYVDIRWDSINFRKPTPGGSANAQRDAYMSLEMIESIQPIIDKAMHADQQYILRVTCKEGAFIDLVGDDDKSLGTSSVQFIDLCFPKESQMKNWRSILVSPSLYTSFKENSTIPVGDLEIKDIEEIVPMQTGDNTHMAIRSDLTGIFAPREFHVVRGKIHWMRVGQKQQTSRQKSLEIANAHTCFLTSARAVEVSEKNKHTSHKYQLTLEVPHHIITIGMKEESTLLFWLNTVREIVTMAPVDQIKNVYISNDIERVEEVAAEEDEEELDLAVDTRATEIEGAKNGLQGYLYKKTNRMLSTNSNVFRRRWYVLHEYTLYWYKSSLEAQAGFPPQGVIDLSSVYEVRESIDADAPENSIDIVTNAKTMTIAAVDETDYSLWMDALSDTLEIREMAIQKEGFNGGSKADQAERGLSKEERMAERIAAIRSSIVHGGPLSMKNAKDFMFKSSWKERYFVIASGALTYYQEQSDMFDENKECKGEIALVNVLVVETSQDPKYKGGSGSVFDMHARVIDGGDANGMRIFTFDARSVENAERWMRELCKATEILELLPVGSGQFASSVCEKLVHARNTKRMIAGHHSNSSHLLIQTNRSTEMDDDYVTVDSDEQISSEGRARGPSMDLGGPGQGGGGRGSKRTPAGRGGMGRGTFIRNGSKSQHSGKSDTNDEIHLRQPGENYDDLYGDGVL